MSTVFKNVHCQGRVNDVPKYIPNSLCSMFTNDMNKCGDTTEDARAAADSNDTPQ